MTTTETQTDISSTLDEIREDILNLQRSAVVTETKPVMNYRSYGEYVKGVAKGEDEAVTLYRAWTGGTSDDSVLRDTWIGDKSRLISKPRKVINAFGTASLPAEGLNLEYAKLDANTLAVTAQAAEGDTLAYGNISFTTATVPIKTYGGYSTLTKQEVERANVAIVDKVFTGLGLAYANATNAAVRAAVVAASTASVTGPALATAKGKDWLGVVVDVATALDTYNYELDGFLVSGDVFKQIATLTDSTDRPLLYTSNPSNNVGSVGGLSATLAGVPITVDPGAAAKTMWGITKEAATTYESAGVPFRLNDDDITNLTNAYSVYGFMAFGITDSNGIVKVTVS